MSPVEERRALAKRKALYLELHPETKQHVAGAHGANQKLGRDATAKMAFATDAARKTGESVRTVRRKTRTGERVAPDVLDRLNSKCLKGAEIDILAALTHDQQRAAVAMMESGEAKSLRQATARINHSNARQAAGIKPTKVSRSNVAEKEASEPVEGVEQTPVSAALAAPPTAAEVEPAEVEEQTKKERDLDDARYWLEAAWSDASPEARATFMRLLGAGVALKDDLARLIDRFHNIMEVGERFECTDEAKALALSVLGCTAGDPAAQPD